MVYYCELCGKQTPQQLKRRSYYGEVLMVCEACMKDSQRSAQPRTPQTGMPRPPPGPKRTPQAPPRVNLDIVENYAQIIREARLKAGLSIQDFAQKSQIKESVLRRIEAGKLVPDLETARKLEKALRVSVITEQASESDTKTGAAPNEHKLVDVVKIRDSDEEA